jgi:hypothetical protein
MTNAKAHAVALTPTGEAVFADGAPALQENTLQLLAGPSFTHVPAVKARVMPVAVPVQLRLPM